MTKHRQILYGSRVPQDWLDAIQEYIGSYVSANFRLVKASSSSLKVAAGTDNDQVGIAINGRWRYNTADATAAHPGGTAGSYDVFVTASDNNFVPGSPETDLTDYSFGLQIKPTGQVPTTVLYRKVGTVTWDGSSITGISPLTGDLGSAVVLAPDSQIRNRVATSASITNVITGMRSGDAAERVSLTETGIAAGPGNAGQDVAFSRDATGPRWTSTVPINATGFQVGGVALAASHLSNGVTGSGSVVLATSPALAGTPTAPTAAADTSTTQIATTAFVMGQLASANPLMDGAAAVGVSTRFARQDHVHPTDTSRAPLASPALTGTPTAPTAAVDTNTTQIATTAFVLAQASAAGDGTPAMDGTAARGTATHWARADHVHPTDTSRAPLASPALTGTPTAPTPTAGDSSTRIATTAFVGTAIGTATVPINTQTASYTLVLSDQGGIVQMNSGSAQTLTVPPNSSVAFPIGTVIVIVQLGAGALSVAAGAGVTINANPGLNFGGRYAQATLYKRATDTWVLAGNLTP